MKRWGDIFSGIGTVILSLLSCAICPMCLPFYAGCLSVIGIELIDIHAYFFPITMVFGLFTLGFMAYQIHTHHGLWLPFKIAMGAILGMLVAVYFGYDYFLYAFLALFMGCILWNKKSLAHAGKTCC